MSEPQHSPTPDNSGSVLGILLLLFGIGSGIFVLGEESPRFQHQSSLTGSGLVSAASILSGALLIISREHRK